MSNIFDELEKLDSDSLEQWKRLKEIDSAIVAEQHRLVEQYAMFKKGHYNKPIVICGVFDKSFNILDIGVSVKRKTFNYFITVGQCGGNMTLSQSELAEALRKGEEELVNK